ncbi:Centromere/kinetochore protein zw10 [Apophysomyces sp. BC1034]|nr:Centromere/kinetochore protein zw10 [Apophysomyces sp. BC1015]KAG0181550.1 Centromere/kinetochore protein zw10 [Apophysomyces sp. BC1021]KAG0192087.1 Centromere/kinetochore protein zw10 [Apophysomyces sp. BC1034]
MPPLDQIRETFISNILDENAYSSVLNDSINAESLTSILSGLNATSLTLHKQLFEDICGNFDEFSASYQQSQELHKDVLGLTERAARSSSGEATCSIDTQTTVADILLEYSTALDQSTLNQQTIDALETLTKLAEEIKRAELELNAKSLLEATKSVLGLKDLLIKLEEDKNSVCRWENVAAVRSIQLKAGQLQEQLQHMLQDCLDTAITYNQHQTTTFSMRVLHTFKPDPSCSKSVTLKEVFESFSKLNLLPLQMGRLKRTIFKYVIQPLLERGSNFRIHLSDVHESCGEGGLLQLIAEKCDEGRDQQADSITKIQQVGEVFRFFFKYIFGNQNKDTHMTHLFGNLLLPETFQLLIRHWITFSIPTFSADLKNFDLVARAAKTLEEDCTHTYTMLVIEPNSEGLLSGYTKNIDVHFAKKLQEKVLLEGRKVMLRKVYESEDTVEHVNHEEQSVVQHYQITQTPQLLAVVLRDTVAEASSLIETHPVSASKLIDVVRDLLYLYRAILPSFHRSQFLSNPANALVFRNDCYWLASQLIDNVAIAKGCERFEDLRPSFHDAADRLRALGSSWHNLVMAQRIQILQSMLDRMNGFVGINEDRANSTLYDEVVERVVEQIQTFGSLVRPVVDKTLFLDLMGRIVDSVLKRLTKDIEDLADIGAEESHMIARTLNSFAQLVGAFDIPGDDASESSVSELVPNWQKFWLVKDILEMGLRDIMAAFHRGDLYTLDKSELIGLICALFKDTEFRDTSIREIRTNTSENRHIGTDKVTEANGTKVSEAFQNTSVFDMRDNEISFDDEGKGWGDADEDLFVNEANHPADKKPQEAPVIPHISALAMDIPTCDDEGGGWGDADEDLFEIEENTKKEHTQTSAKLTKALAPPPLVVEESNEGSGWDEADEDLFGIQS